VLDGSDKRQASANRFVVVVAGSLCLAPPPTATKKASTLAITLNSSSVVTDVGKRPSFDEVQHVPKGEAAHFPRYMPVVHFVEIREHAFR
jgi:hypothetical protein